jgi:hypothetical protein
VIDCRPAVTEDFVAEQPARSLALPLRHLRIHPVDGNSSGARLAGFGVPAAARRSGILNETEKELLTQNSLCALYISTMSLNSATAFADPAPSDPAPDQPAACPHCALGRRVEQRLAMLQQLAEFGMAAAAVAKQQIIDQAERDRGAAPDSTGARDEIARNFQLDFSRAALAVRQTLALQERIEQDHLARIDRQAAEAAARRAEDAQRRAARRQAAIERRRARLQQDIEHVIKAKAPLLKADRLILDLTARLRPERLDWDFGDAPLREIFLRICRSLGVPESWSQHWDEGDEGDESEGPAPAGAPDPIRAAGPANPAAPDEAAGSDEAETPPERRQSPPPRPDSVPDNRASAPAAAPAAPRLTVPGTGPP